MLGTLSSVREPAGVVHGYLLAWRCLGSAADREVFVNEAGGGGSRSHDFPFELRCSLVSLVGIAADADVLARGTQAAAKNDNARTANVVLCPSAPTQGQNSCRQLILDFSVSHLYRFASCQFFNNPIKLVFH